MATGQPINRSYIDIPLTVSNDIIQKTQEQSTIMRLAKKIDLPGGGAEIPVITGDPEPEWVSETGLKPVKFPSMDKKIMKGHTLAVIVPFSNQFRRDARKLYDELVKRLPGAIAKKYDQTCYFGNPGGALSNFDSLASVEAASLQSSVYLGLVDADTNISEEGGIVDGYVFSPKGRAMLLKALDGENRPLFTPGPASNGVPTILGANTYFTAAAYKAGSAASGSDAAVPDTVGFAGDWSHARYGIVENIDLSISDQATLTYVNDQDQTVTLNLWQQNMFAVRCEFEAGFVVEDAYFNRLTRTHV